MVVLDPLLAWTWRGDLDVGALTAPGDERTAARLARRDTEPAHVAWLEAADGAAPPRPLRWWRERGLLARDPEPVLRVLAQTTPHGATTAGLLGLLRVDEQLVPHEDVDEDAVARRAARMRQEEVDARPLLAVLLGEPDGLAERLTEVMARPSSLDLVTDDGVRHRLWDVPDARAREMTAALGPVPALLADGHHRVAAARTISPAPRLPTFLTPPSTGPALRPVWRVVRIDPAASDAVTRWLRARSVPDGEVVVCAGTQRHRLRVPTGTLPVAHAAQVAGAIPGTVRLHTTSDPVEARAQREAGRVVVAAPAPRLGDVLELAGRGRRLPPKSTAFDPKPRVGLVLARRA